MHRVLILSYHFPPAASAGAFRTIRFVKYLPEFGWSPLVVAPLTHDLYPAQLDPSLESSIPSDTVVVRTRVLRPSMAVDNAVRAVSRCFRGRSSREATGVHDASAARTGCNGQAAKRSWLRRAVLFALACAFEVPDIHVGWLLPAVRAGASLIRRYRPLAIYSSGPPHSAHLIAVALKYLSGLPLVIDLRDPWSRSDWQRSHTGSWRVQRSLERLCIRWSDRVILNTPRLCDEFRQFYGAAFHAKFLAIPNGYDPDLLPLADTLLARNARACTNGSIRVCHPGTIYGARNLQCVAAAIARLAEAGYRVTLEQVGVVEQSSALQQYLRENQLEPCFQFRGPVSHAEALDRMAAADVLLVLQPGTSIQVPGKLFEMLPFRKPVVALTREGATADIIERFKLGVVADPADTDAISSAILDAAYGRSGCSQSGWDRALRAFDGRRLTSELAQVLDGLI